MPDTNTPTPTPYYIAEGDSHFEIVRKFDGDVRPVDSATFGSNLGAHIARVSFVEGGVPSREQALANAQFIVEACNAHEAYQNLVGDMLRFTEQEHADVQHGHYYEWVQAARKAQALSSANIILRASSLETPRIASNSNRDKSAPESDKMSGDVAAPIPTFEADDAQPNRERLSEGQGDANE